MQRTWVYVMAAIAAALIAAYAAYAVNAPSQINNAATTTATTVVVQWGRAVYVKRGPAPCPVNATVYPPAGWGRGRWGVWRNVTVYPPTAKNITISMTSSQVSLQLELVGIVRGPSAFAEVVAGSGSITAGGRTYNVVSAYGAAGSNYFALRIYTGNALITVWYFNGVYRVAVQQLGSTQITIYYGNATAQIT